MGRPRKRSSFFFIALLFTTSLYYQGVRLLSAQTIGCDGESGMTIIEILVVVLIIGIIVTIAIPTFSSTGRTAQDGVCAGNLPVDRRRHRSVRGAGGRPPSKRS